MIEAKLGTNIIIYITHDKNPHTQKDKQQQRDYIDVHYGSTLHFWNSVYPYIFLNRWKIIVLYHEDVNKYMKNKIKKSQFLTYTVTAGIGPRGECRHVCRTFNTHGGLGLVRVEVLRALITDGQAI